MLVAALSQAFTTKVPNILTFSAIIVGWLVAISITCSAGVNSNGGGIDESFSATILGLFLLIPLYRITHLGAGCVKMQMAFGAWIGCAVPLHRAIVLTLAGTILGILLTAILLYVQVRSRARKSPGGSEIPRSRLLPAQITLSIGSILGVVAAVLLGIA
jgi:Flp pilus assembly protein protease CpaA